eukprot:11510827-Alexandrium_andersonii.AAC.1
MVHPDCPHPMGLHPRAPAQFVDRRRRGSNAHTCNMQGWESAQTIIARMREGVTWTWSELTVGNDRLSSA